MGLPYSLTWEQFETFVLPHLQRCSVVDKNVLSEGNNELGRDIYYAATTLSPGWQQQSYLFDKHAILNLDIQRLAYMADSTSRAVALLHRCKERNIESVKWVAAHNACEICKGQAQITHRVEHLLDAYRGVSRTMTLPCPKCRYLNMDGGGWCRCCLIEASSSPTTGNERKVSGFLSKLMQKHGL